LRHPVGTSRIHPVRVVVLGGAGEVGAALSRDLAACSDVAELIVADVDRVKAETLAGELGRPAVPAAVDVHDRAGALAVLEGADVIVNCTSFTLFDAVVRLASEARVPYADLLSEPSDEHRRLVEEAGITAISGLGATPGLSNVLVRHAADELDELEEAHVSWVSFRTIAPAAGLLDTILWELADDCPTRRYYQNGRFHRAGFMEGSRLVEFPPPVGRQRVYYVPHTEVTTLPAHFPTLRFCAVRGTWRPELMEDIRVLNKYGLLDGPALEHTKARIWERFGGQRDEAPWLLFVNVEVIATGGGREVRRVYDVSHPTTWGQDGTGRMTGVCAAVGVQLLARHGATEPGFVDPELYYEPKEFLAELARRATVEVAWEDEWLT
jgi:saccharopine dehydrogenase-like NADP-dependent oxidoreductase